MNPFLLFDRDGPVVTLTMNDPERRNPLTDNTAVDEFLAAFDRIRRDSSIRAVILTGAGNAFSAGGNMHGLARHASGEIPGTQIRHEYQIGIQRLPPALFDLEVPVIAAINGPAIGAGLDLACACDLRIASTKASFAESFVKLGLISGDGGAWLLPRVIGLPRAAEMTFTGDAIDANTALAWQLVSDVVEPDQLLPRARHLAERIARNPPQALRMGKRLLHEAIHSPLSSVLELAAAFQALAHLTPENRAAVDAFFAARRK